MPRKSETLHSIDELRSKRQDTFLALVAANDHLNRHTLAFMKGYGLSPPQYNVLRILRGAGAEGKPSQSIAADMISKVPDVSRLVGRLVVAGLADRHSDPDDRRVVRVVITPAGLALLESMDEPIAELHTSVLQRLPVGELTTLLGLLEKI